MDFNITDQLLFIYSEFVKYFRQNEITELQCISYIQTSRKPMIQLGRRFCIIISLSLVNPSWVNYMCLNLKGEFASVHDPNTYMGSGCITPHILHLNTRWERVVKPTRCSFLPGQKSLYPTNKRLGWHQSCSGHSVEDQHPPVPVRIRNPDCPVCADVTILAELSHIYVKMKLAVKSN